MRRAPNADSPKLRAPKTDCPIRAPSAVRPFFQSKQTSWGFIPTRPKYLLFFGVHNGKKTAIFLESLYFHRFTLTLGSAHLFQKRKTGNLFSRSKNMLFA